MKPELIVFDLAGTTVHDRQDVHRVLQHVMSVHGVAITLEDANKVMGIPKPEAIRKLLDNSQVQHTDMDGWVAIIHRDFIQSMMSFYREDEFVNEKQGVSDTFRKLKDRGIKVAVDTGFDRMITDVLLRRLGWLDAGLIDASVTSDEVRFGRPYPDMVFRAMVLTDVHDPRRVMKVGDTTVDLLEGANAGCGFVVGVTTGAHDRSQLEQCLHTHLIEQVAEVLTIVDTAI